MSSSGRVPRKALVALLACLLVLAGLFLIVHHFLPSWLEAYVVGEMESNGLEVRGFPVESARLTRTSIGSGGIAYGPHVLDWENLLVTYSPAELMDGKLETLVLEQPRLSLDLVPPVAAAVPAVAGEARRETASPDEPARAAERAAPGPGEPASGKDVAKKSLHKPGRVTPQAVIQSIPFEETRFEKGRLELQIPHLDPVSLEMEGHFHKDRESVSGGLTLTGDVITKATLARVRFQSGPGGGQPLWVEARAAPPEGDGAPYIAGRLDRDGSGTRLEMESTPPLAWLNELLRLSGYGDVVLSGEAPSVGGRLSWQGLLPKGQFRLALQGLHLSRAGSVELDGISGDWSFRVRALPRSDGVQELRIESITTGTVELAGARVLWALPTLRMLRIEEAAASLAGGRVMLEPFTMDPSNPEVRTRLLFKELPGNTFMEWLGEDRFRIEGFVSGGLDLLWREGILYLGDGSLEMDTDNRKGRFVFSDPAFLEEQFTAMSGIPDELREPLLAVLLDRGIRLDSLRLDVIPMREQGEVSLRLELSGETSNDRIEVPIRGLVINNLISEEDLGRLLGLMGPVRFLSAE